MTWIKPFDEPEPQVEDDYDSANIVRKVLAGREWVISHSGASQYTIPGGGVSACGIAALNCVRVVLGKEQDGLRGEALLQDLTSRDTAEVCFSRHSCRIIC
jgi:hypothetical protein